MGRLVTAPHLQAKQPVVTTLDTLRPGQRGKILQLGGEPALTVRLMEMGLLAGEPVELLGVAPLGDPISVLIRGSRLALRRRDAAAVKIELV